MHNTILIIAQASGAVVFDPREGGPIEYECIPPTEDDDEPFESIIVHTQKEADEYEARGYTVFPWPVIQ